MSRKRRQLLLSADHASMEVEIGDRVRRLREMLVLMAPETGSSALGATIPYLQPIEPRGEQLLLPSPKAANF